MSTFLIGLFAPVLILLFLLFFRFDPSANGITGGELLAYVLNEIGAALFLVFFSIAPLLVFAVRWGDVLAAPTSLLHSPELFVPLLVRELQLPHNVRFASTVIHRPHRPPTLPTPPPHPPDTHPTPHNTTPLLPPSSIG